MLISVIMAFTLFLVFVYFVPSMIAYEKPQFNQILALNILTGWTGIGWLISLLWALNNPKV